MIYIDRAYANTAKVLFKTLGRDVPVERLYEFGNAPSTGEGQCLLAISY